MKKLSSRLATCINPKLDAKLVAYMAAGLGTLAASFPAEAKVVYTAANATFGHGGSVDIDLNNDGIVDFKLFDFYSQPVRVPLGYRQNVLEIIGRTSANQVCEVQSNGQEYVAALPARTKVPSGCTILPAVPSQVLAFSAGSYSTAALKGPWAVRPDAYLGVKFLIHGITHYGWVRVNVSQSVDTVTVVGYAYETVPNKPISTGMESGAIKTGALTPTDPLPLAAQPASLGMLARGADALSLWRREEIGAD